ncbi:MAG TPA: histidine kinase dimerization/phosphoacceptor domain -containing protein [Methanocella sp.]|nr:histidine kinase dimerization/phosphoacceptor domain -containing protein [Methanocella sp.]
MNSIKFINIEEVNKKLNDTALVIEDLIMQSPDGMCLCDPEGNIIKMNNSFANIFGILMSEDRNINIFEHQFNEKDLSAEFARARQGRIISIDDFKIDTNSDVRYLSIRLFPTLSSDNIITHFILMAEDITFRKMAEEKLKKVNEELEVRVQERTSELLILNETLQEEIVEHGLDEEKLKVSLKEKEVLLKEIHHRVKNNMQIVSSMLDLQAKYVNNPELTRVFKDSQSRIRSMALIHEKLYMSDNLAKINFKEYTNTLARNLYISFRLDKCIEIRTEVENIWFNIDTSIPLGLIINELVSNSLIHAFQDRENGIVTITISKKENDTYHLIVKDDGIGMKNTVNISQSKTLGLKLVNALVKQINGDMKIKSDRGTCFQIIFSCSEK